MNIVVVGGAGFIGSHLVDRLLAEGHVVDVVDDLSTGSLANLADARAAGGALKIHNLDALSADLDSLIGLRRPDLIHHLALLPRAERSPAAQGAGFTAALAMLEAARAHGVGKVVVALPASSLHGRPATKDLPVKEGEPEPRGVRGVVARAIIDLLANYREREMIEFTALALASVYGPRQRADGGVAAAFALAAAEGRAPTIHGDGRQTRDFVYVDDVVDALVRAGERGSGLVVNIGTGEQTSIRDLWAKIGVGTSIEPLTGAARPDGLVRFAVSPVRARIHLAWAPWTTIDEGLPRLRP
jgi:UDP-glucose 4-epimerase